MLSSFAHASESKDLLLPAMGHIVIHHRCRSRLVGGAEALSGCTTVGSNCRLGNQGPAQRDQLSY